MPLLSVLLIALGLAMDAFAVSLAASVRLRRVSGRQLFRFGFHFGLFQALMPVIGWFAGRVARPLIEAWDHWVAFGLLVLIGGKALWEALREEELAEEVAMPRDPTRGWSLVLFSVATSIDALAVGVSLAMLGEAIWRPALVIGLITGGLTVLGMLIGSRLGRRFGRWIEVVGGLVLIGIGVKILMLP